MKIKSRAVVLSAILFFSLNNLFSQTQHAPDDEATLDSLLNIKVSSATKYWQSVSEAPASVSIITATQIERYGYRSLEEVLRGVRGFYISNDRNYSYIGSRGFSRPSDYNDRLLLLFDGHTANDNVYGGAAIGNDFPLDLSCIERIEIVRGPGSALYGTGAMFAVINIIPKRGKDIDGAILSADVGSSGRIGGTLLYGRELDEATDFLLSLYGTDIKGDDLYFSEFDEPLTNNGIATQIDWERFAGLHASLRHKRLTLSTMATTRRKSIPTGAYGTQFNAPGFESVDKRAFLELKVELPVANDKNFFIRGYYDYYDYWGSYPYPTVLNYDASVGNWAGSEAQLQWDIFPGNRFTFGGEWKDNPRADYTNWTTDTIYFDKNFPFTAYSFYLQDEFQVLDNLAVTLGIRRDEYSSTGGSTIPRFAIVYNTISGGTLKLLYGEGFRAPNVYEGNYEDALSQWKKNPNLRSEKISTKEIVYEQRLTNTLFGVFSLYTYRMTDLIDSYKDSNNISQFQNISEVNAYGIEAEITYRTEDGIKVSASGAYQQAKDPSTDAVLSNSPAYTARIGIIYPVMQELTIGAEGIYNSERITVYKTTLDPFILARATVSVQPESHSESWIGRAANHCKFVFLADNIFNTSYSTPGGVEHLQEGIPQDGRNFRFKISYGF